MMRNASIRRVLHDFKSSVERLLEALEVRKIVHPDREVQIGAFVENLDAVLPELTESGNLHFQRQGRRAESCHFPHCGQLTGGHSNRLRRPAEQSLATKQNAVLFVDVLAGGRLETRILLK